MALPGTIFPAGDKLSVFPCALTFPRARPGKHLLAGALQRQLKLVLAGLLLDH